MAEFSEWFWGAITNMTWYEKGVLWRQRMADAGYLATEAWFIDEFGDDVRQSGLNQTVLLYMTGIDDNYYGQQ